MDRVLSEMCLEISKRYEINFLEIGTDKDHAHFSIQSILSYSPNQNCLNGVKSIIAREVFIRVPNIKRDCREANSGESDIS